MAEQQYETSSLRAAIFAGCMVAFLGFGFAATFGVFLTPMSQDLGWGRETFSLSVAVQLLTWGFAQPIAGAIADRFGTARVLAFGAVCAGIGFALRGMTTDPTAFVLTGILVGVGTGSASFPIVIGALGKIVSAERRSFILGLGTAAASLGMFVAAPTATMMIGAFGWQPALVLIGCSFALILPFLIFIARVSNPTASGSSAGDFGHALAVAFTDRSYVCLFFGFFVCGFHVAFIQTHLPAYVMDLGLAATIGAWSLALIGLFNIAGSFLVRLVGSEILEKDSSQRHLLCPSYRDCHFHSGACNRLKRFGLFRRNGAFVAFNSATNHGACCADARAEVPVDAGGSCLSKSPDRQLYWRMAWRAHL